MYRIIELERIDSSSLPVPLQAGMARWSATVQFWPDAGGPNGTPVITDDIIFERPTQSMAPGGGDNWVLRSTDDTLIEFLEGVISSVHDRYMQLCNNPSIQSVLRDHPESHGKKIANDSIAHNAKVRAHLNKPKSKRN